VSFTVAQRQQTIIDDLAASVGDSTALRDRVALYWAQFSDRDAIIPWLTDQYVRRRAAQYLVGPLRTQYDQSTADLKESFHQQVDTLERIITDATSEIVRLEAKAARSRMGASSTLAPVLRAYPVLPLHDDRRVYLNPFDDEVVPRNPTMQGR
jgi:hypothetical protein